MYWKWNFLNQHENWATKKEENTKQNSNKKVYIHQTTIIYFVQHILWLLFSNTRNVKTMHLLVCNIHPAQVFITHYAIYIYVVIISLKLVTFAASEWACTTMAKPNTYLDMKRKCGGLDTQCIDMLLVIKSDWFNEILLFCCILALRLRNAYFVFHADS